MRKYAGLFTSLTLGMALAAGAPALAQQAPAAAATVNLAPGTIVYDSEGKEIGPIASAEGGNVVVTVGEQRTMPVVFTPAAPAIAAIVARPSLAPDFGFFTVPASLLAPATVPVS